MLNLLVENSTLTIFVVLLLGFLIGSIRMFGFSLGSAGVLFAGLLVSALDPKVKLDPIVYELGLALFVYTIALASGHHFVQSLNREGVRRNALVLGMLSAASGVTLFIGQLLNLAPGETAGLFAGSFTNTPALAGVIQAIGTREGVGDPIVTYSITYPMGVIGVMLAIFLLEKRLKVNYSQEAQNLHLATEELVSKSILIAENQSGTLLDLVKRHRWPIVFGRISHEGKMELANPGTVLQAGDIISVIGTPEDVRQVIPVLGREHPESLAADRSQLDFRRIFVSNPQVAGRSLKQLHFNTLFGATITRVRRGDRDIIPNGNTVLELGDRVRVVTPVQRVQDVTRFFGDSYKHLSEINLLTFSVGLTAGLLLGALQLPLPGGTTFQLGVAGGSLLVGLLLGALGRTGRLLWTIPYSANLTLRQFGLALFLAGVGLRSGSKFAAQIGSVKGLMLFLSGTLLTCLMAALTLWIGHRLLRIPFSVATGVLSGLQTHPAVLGYASERTGNEAPEIGYASVYPVAMIAKILMAQILFGLASRGM